MNKQSKPSKLIKGSTGEWEVVIGMEVHAQVSSKSKLFSGASTEFGGEPNSHVSLVDAAMPMPDLARSTRLPDTILPSFISWSSSLLDMMTRS